MLFAGSEGCALFEVMAIASVGAPATRFQFASTALTVFYSGVRGHTGLVSDWSSDVWSSELVSPGISSCSFAKVPALTVVEGEVLAVLVPSLASVAVTVLDRKSVV